MTKSDGGELIFGARLGTDELNNDANKATSILSNIGKDAIPQWQKIEASLKNIGVTGVSSIKEFGDAINEQKSKVEELEKTAAKLEEMLRNTGNIKDTFLIKQLEPIKKQLADTYGQLDEQTAKLKVLGSAHSFLSEQQNKNTQTTGTLMTQMRVLREEMGEIVIAANENGENYKENERYQQLEEELKKVGLAYAAVRKEQKALTTAGTQLQGLVSMMSGISGAFTAFRGVSSMFVTDNEKLVKIQTQLQQAMSITMGLQSVSNTLHQTSAFRMHTATKATALWKTSVNGLSVSLGISNAAAKALMVTLTAFGVGAIMMAISALTKFISKQREAKKATDEMAKSVADMTAKNIADVNRLAIEWQKLSTLEEKKKFIDSNKAAFDALGVSIKSVVDAENLLISNKDNFINSMLLKAQASAYMDKATNIYKNEIENITKLKDEYDGFLASMGAEKDKRKADMTSKFQWGFGDDKEKWDDDVKEDYINTLKNIDAKFEAELASKKKAWEDAVKAANDEAGKYLKSSIEAGEKADFELKLPTLRPDVIAKTSEEVNALVAQIKRLKKEIAEVRKDETVSDADTKIVDINKLDAQLSAVYANYKTLTGKDYESEIEARKKLYEDIAELVRKGEADVAQGIIDAKEEGLEKILAQIEFDKQKQIEAHNKREKEHKNTSGSLFSKEDEKRYADLRLQAEEAANKAIEDARNKHVENLTDLLLTEEEIRIKKIKEKYEDLDKSLEVALANDLIPKEIYIELKTHFEKSESDELYGDLLNKYKSYEQQKTEINTKFNAEREKIEKSNYDDKEKESLIAAIEDARLKALEDVTNKELDTIFQNSELLTDIFSDVSYRTKESIDEIIESTKQLIDYLNGVTLELPEGITMEDAEKIKGSGKDIENIYKRVIDLQNEVNSGGNGFGAGIISGFNMLKQSAVMADIALNTTDEKLKDIAQNEAALLKAAGIKMIAGEAAKAAGMLSGLSSSLVDLADATGNEGLGKAASVVGEIAGSVQNVASGFANGGLMGGIAAAAGEAISWITKAFKAHDEKLSKQIEEHQKSIDKLKQEYDKLDRAISKAFSTDASKLIEKQIEYLEKQTKLIEEQRKLENEKKKPDQDAIDEYDNILEENKNNLEDLRDAAVDVIFGEDVKSAINNFSKAYVDAWGAGENKAKAMKDVVRNMIKEAVRLMMNSDLEIVATKVREHIKNAIENGIPVDWGFINNLIDNATDEMERKYGGYDELFNDKSERSAAKKGFAAMTQDSANELNASFGVLRVLTAEIKFSNQIIADNTGKMLTSLENIDTNTRRLERVEKDIGKVHTILDSGKIKVKIVD